MHTINRLRNHVFIAAAIYFLYVQITITVVSTSNGAADSTSTCSRAKWRVTVQVHTALFCLQKE